MSTATGRMLELDDVTAALAVASRAPSIHNTQPWLWELREGVLELRADRTRQLAVADEDGHSLLVSCGAALSLTEISLRARGSSVIVERFPDPADPDLLARIRGLDRGAPRQRDGDLVRLAMTRRSERRPFAPTPVSAEQIEAMRTAAASRGAFVHFAVRPGEALDLATVVSHADRVELQQEGYVAELDRWTNDGGDARDGVPASVVPHLEDGSPRHTDVPLRDFEAGVSGGQLVAGGVDERPLLAVILTDGNAATDQLAAGEAMMRLMLEAAALGLATCPLSQAVDMPVFRSRLRTLMSWTAYPQMMLRIGNLPAGAPAPLTRRRRLDEVFRFTPATDR
jgi:nitroreductase